MTVSPKQSTLSSKTQAIKPVTLGANAIVTQLGNLEEDDEFEEFTPQEWNEENDESNADRWEDNWDDDDVEPDFSAQLREEQSRSVME